MDVLGRRVDVGDEAIDAPVVFDQKLDLVAAENSEVTETLGKCDGLEIWTRQIRVRGVLTKHVAPDGAKRLRGPLLDFNPPAREVRASENGI